MIRNGLSRTLALVLVAVMTPAPRVAAEPWSPGQIARLCHVGGGGPWTFGVSVAGDALAQLGANSLGPFATAAAMTTDWSGRVYAVWYVTPSASRAQSLRRTQDIAGALRAANWVEVRADGYHDDTLGYVEAQYEFVPPGVSPDDAPVALAIEGSDSQFRVTCTHSDLDDLNRREVAGKLETGAIRPKVPPPVTLSPPTAAWCEREGNAAAYAALMSSNAKAGDYFHLMSARAYQARRLEVWKRWRLIASARFMAAELDAMSHAALTRLSEDGSSPC